MITSRHNSKVKQAAALRNRKQRVTEGLTLIDGPRETLRALAAGVSIRQIFYCEQHAGNQEAVEALTAGEAAGAERLDVSAEVFEKLNYGDRTDGVISVGEVKTLTLADLQLTANPLVAVIERVEKPGNLGAILRAADGAGIDAVIAADPVIDLFNPNVIRASVGAVFKANVAVATAADTLEWLGRMKLPIYATRPDATINYFAADFTGGAAIALGNEARGLTDLWGEEVTAIALPMRGIADSLNVSTAAAVMFYEALRQRS